MGGKKRKTGGKIDAKERNFLKTFGESHPIEDFQSGKVPKKVQIIEDEDDDSDESVEESSNQISDINLDENDTILPYQLLLNDLNKISENDSINELTKKKKQKKNKNKKNKEDANKNNNEEKANDESNDEIVIDEDTLYAKEVFCKDNNENDEVLKKDEFQHFEIDLSDKNIDLLKTNSILEIETINLPTLGHLSYQPRLSDYHHNLNISKKLENFTVKQRLMERLGNAIEHNIPNNLNEQLDEKQNELINIILNYIDLYVPNIDFKSDINVKFIYTLHALNHVLKTRSRIIAHNDKIKQNQNKSNEDVEHLDQGLTRPKVLILVPFRKDACKIVKIIISLLMNKSEEYITNKKRFFDEFSDAEYKNDDDKDDKDKQSFKGEDYEAVFSGNIDDHFRVGLSVSKKTLKLYTEFYSSDIIIASPLGLRTVIGDEGDKASDSDFLSSIELLIVDNADVLLMQNWDHVQAIFDNLHLQPKKSHDVDFSRVRRWVLNGHSKYYRQTLIFSSIPAPQINSLFNKYCFNYEGKAHVKVINQIGTICQIGFQLAQVFHRIHCDSPADLPKARFEFFIEKILPQFKDEMMSHTLIFIPSYFDFVQIRNYFKKNDLSAAHISEYSDKKSIDRSRLIFFDGRVHYLLLTERFHFYKRYRIRGINHLIFYDLPNYPNYYSAFCNFLPDPKRSQKATQTFSSTVLYSKFDAQKLSAVVGHQRASHMINSDKSVHMFMVDET